MIDEKKYNLFKKLPTRAFLVGFAVSGLIMFFTGKYKNNTKIAIITAILLAVSIVIHTYISIKTSKFELNRNRDMLVKENVIQFNNMIEYYNKEKDSIRRFVEVDKQFLYPVDFEYIYADDKWRNPIHITSLSELIGEDKYKEFLNLAEKIEEESFYVNLIMNDEDKKKDLLGAEQKLLDELFGRDNYVPRVSYFKFTQLTL